MTTESQENIVNSTSSSNLSKSRHKKNQINLFIMIVLTSAYFLVEIVVGYVTKSNALVADSFHMLTDVPALMIAFASVHLSQKQWPKNTFGLARAEIVGALINAVFLLALCFTIVIDSIQRFVEPVGISNPKLVLYVGSFGLLVNLIGLFMFHDHHHGHGHGHSHGHSHSHDSKVKTDPKKGNFEEDGSGDASASQMNIRGVFLHILADALGSVVVIASALVVWLTDWEYENYIDPVLSVLLVILICFSTWPLLVSSTKILLQNIPDRMCIRKLEEKIREGVGLEKKVWIHDLHVWQLTGNKLVGSVHVVYKEDEEGREEDENDLVERISGILKTEGIDQVTVQVERWREEEGQGKENGCILRKNKGKSNCDSVKLDDVPFISVSLETLPAAQRSE